MPDLTAAERAALAELDRTPAESRDLTLAELEWLAGWLVGQGPPAPPSASTQVKFETIAFRENPVQSDDEILEHCSTWDQAERQHEQVVEQLRANAPKP